jgi:hypothetical protein
MGPYFLGSRDTGLPFRLHDRAPCTLNTP